MSILPDATLSVSDGKVKVVPYGSDLLAPVIARGQGYADAAAASATLAGQYANAETDVDIAGAPAGSRGAKWWALVAQGYAAVMSITIGVLANISGVIQDINGRWWLRFDADGTTRIQKLRDVSGRDPIAIIDSNTGRLTLLETFQSVISAAVSAIGVAFDILGNIAGAVQDSNGRWWLQYRTDGTTRIQKLRDATGRDPIALIDSNITRLTSLESFQATLPVAQRLKLKKALYYGALMKRQVAATDPITVGAWASSTTLTSPVVIARDDSRVRLLAGKWLPGTGTPGGSVMYGQAETNGDPSIINGVGLPQNRYSIESDVEIVLPAGQTVVEVVILGSGAASNFFVDIDGVGTNAAGYPTPPGSTGNLQYLPLTLPASAVDRRVRMTFPGRPFGGLRLETGGTIKAYTPQVPLSMAFLGDSITEGSVASNVMNKWARIAAQMLGVDNMINLGIGSSGYIGRRNPTYTINTTAGSPNVVVTGAPLLAGQVISAAGIPTGTTVVTGAATGGTAVLSVNATATASNVSTAILATVNLTAGSTSVGVVAGNLVAGTILADNLQGVRGLPTRGAIVVTGATAGGTAIISEKATATILSQSVEIKVGYNFLDRIDDVLTAVNGGPPDALVIAGGINDLNTFPIAQLGEQALTLFQKLRAAAPDMLIFVVGPWVDYNHPAYDGNWTPGRDAIFAAAAQVPRIHTIDVSGLVTLSNRDTVFDGNVNGPHPIDGGHLLYGDYIARQIAAIAATY